MKVPKMYKSSDRYNAGTDVIYNDDSKLQYAPFIYATTESGDSGDEGGEYTMVVHASLNEADKLTLDKTFKEIYDAVSNGNVHIVLESGTNKMVCHLDAVVGESLAVLVHTVASDGTLTTIVLVADSENGYPSEPGGIS